MADDTTKKDYRDKTRINMKEPYEVAYFKKKFDVSGQALAGAVQPRHRQASRRSASI